jgi:hypothetical protein
LRNLIALLMSLALISAAWAQDYIIDGPISTTQVISASGLYSSGDVTATRAVTAAKFYGDGSALMGIGSSSYNSLTNVPSRLQAVSNGTPFDSTGITVSGIISGSTMISTTAGGVVSGTYGYFRQISGSGAGITNVTAAAVDYPNVTNVPARLQQVAAGTSLSMAAISSSALAVTGTATVGGLLTANNGVNVTGAVTATTNLAAGNSIYINGTRMLCDNGGGTLCILTTMVPYEGITWGNDNAKDLGFPGVGFGRPRNLYMGGTAYVSGSLVVAGLPSSAGTNPACINTTTGQISYAGTTCTSSDGRLKWDVLPLPSSLDAIMRLQPRTYRWIDVHRGQGLQIGLIAQEVETVFPELVATNGDGLKSVNYEQLVAPVISAIQEQQRQIDRLRLILVVLFVLLAVAVVFERWRR